MDENTKKDVKRSVIPATSRPIRQKPNKQWGQHFLRDRSVLEKIIEAARCGGGDTVLEIGPGEGVLTEALLQTGASVIAVETDPLLAGALRARLGGTSLQVISDDILKPGLLSSLSLPASYLVVANIPYNITSALLQLLLTQAQKPSRMVLLLQKEVADRLMAQPPDMSLLSVMCQTYARCRRVCLVPPGAFFPPPKVTSAVVAFDLYQEDALPSDPEAVITLAGRAFRFRRRQLRNTLATREHPKKKIEEALGALKHFATARPEELTSKDWSHFANLLY